MEVIEENEIIKSEGNDLTVSLLKAFRETSGLEYNIFIKVRKGLFCGSESFYLHHNHLLSILDSLTAMHEKLTGQCEIKEEFEEPFIIFKMGKYGHMSVYGQFGETNNGTYLNFELISDQTVLPLLINTIKSFLIN
jgi:hypothetical protein